MKTLKKFSEASDRESRLFFLSIIKKYIELAEKEYAINKNEELIMYIDNLYQIIEKYEL